MTAAIYALLYGPHKVLHHRILDSFKHVPKEVPLRVWFNDVPSATLSHWGKLVEGRNNFSVWDHHSNKPKYDAMRDMFANIKNGSFGEEWVIWFDDDSHIVDPDWWAKSCEWIASKPDMCYTGQEWFIHWRGGQDKFIRQASWHKGVASELIKQRPAIRFAQGAYWWIKADLIRQLNWPDPRLHHNGGDTLLGEAVRQQGLPFHKMPRHCFGVRVNDAQRRGMHEAPAGCADKNTRI